MSSASSTTTIVGGDSGGVGIGSNACDIANGDNNSSYGERKRYSGNGGVERELPKLLLEYSYHLNDDGTKIVCVGINPHNFQPCVIIYIPATRRAIQLPMFEWSFIPISHASIRRYLSYEKEWSSWCSSPNFTLKPIQSRHNVRLARIENNQMRGNRITLNLDEWDRLGELTKLFTAFMVKFEEQAVKIEEYFMAYVQHCRILQKDKLSSRDYFVPFTADSSATGTTSTALTITPTPFNHFRLFHEIPIICRQKLAFELHNMSASKSYLTVGDN